MDARRGHLVCLGRGLTVLFDRDINGFLFVTFFVHGVMFGWYRPAQRGLDAKIRYAHQP
jgi:hypothetical protein